MPLFYSFCVCKLQMYLCASERMEIKRGYPLLPLQFLGHILSEFEPQVSDSSKETFKCVKTVSVF